jgi:hypothetical protein
MRNGERKRGKGSATSSSMLDAVGARGGSNSFSLAERELQGQGKLEMVSVSEDRE